MATMIKEKRREKKKKPKEKAQPDVQIEAEPPLPMVRQEGSSSVEKDHTIPSEVKAEPSEATEIQMNVNIDESKIHPAHYSTPNSTNTFRSIAPEDATTSEVLTTQLEKTNISNDTITSPDLLQYELNSSPEVVSRLDINLAGSSGPEVVFNETLSIGDQTEAEGIVQDACPSAPLFDEPCQQQIFHPSLVQTVVSDSQPKVHCMPLEEAARLFGGAEMSEVRAMSEREEAIVEAGPLSGPEHPLVDLLSTLRCSLKAVERVRGEILRGFREEEKSRARLWKVEKRTGRASERCACGATVDLHVTYEHAELQRSQLPLARMRLESLARDLQDSYCHHQHLALLAHCQIEELIAETIESSKNNIREALALILKELKVADSAPPALAAALQRWARALAAALVDARDLRQLLFLLHHLCRQTRSVRWVASLLRVPANDSIEVARAIALLDLLINGHRERVDAAQECTEDAEEAWEEVDARGCAGAVSDGALRERDLLSLFRAFPLRDMVARLALFRHRDLSQANEYEWGDASGGRGVLKAACGARSLLSVLRRAVSAHALYRRLVLHIVELALQAAAALADLHLHTRATYAPDLELQITTELDATFGAAFELLAAARAPLQQLPFRLLTAPTAMAYCIGLIIMLHEQETKSIECVGVAVPGAVTCGERVRIVSHACADRAGDYELARNVLEFLIQTGLKAKASTCAGGCDVTARECLCNMLRAHPALYPVALHILADLHQVGSLHASWVSALAPQQWRPAPQELHAVLADWAQRCEGLVSSLLLNMDYTPHVGVSMESQLTIGAWLCSYVSHQSVPEGAQWAWLALRRLRTHRAWWAWPLDAPPPYIEGGLFVDAFNLLATSWGHCVPVICSEGVDALMRLARAGMVRDAVHCLSPALLAMAQAPDSVSMTEQFGTLLSVLLDAGPSLVQRALRRGGEPGAALLHKAIAAQLAVDGAPIPLQARVCVWLHLVWGRGGAGGAWLSELVALHTPPQQLDALVPALQHQDAVATEQTRALVAHAARCPCACAAALRALAQRQAAAGAWAALLDALHAQRVAEHKIHVDNAMRQTGWSCSSDDLALHQTATAAVAAPPTSPGHLTLWLLFFQLYLQRPPCDQRNTTAPIGPLFFSGLMKSRTLAYLKKRLQETAAFHQAEVTRLKAEEKKLQPVVPHGRKDAKKVTIHSSTDLDDDFLQATVLFPEGSDGSSDSGSEVGDDVAGAEEAPAHVNRLQNIILYHCEAELITKTYVGWLEEGDKCRASPHTLRPLTDKAYRAACKAELDRVQPPSSPDDEELRPAPAAALVTSAVPLSPFQRVILRLRRYGPADHRRRRKTSIKSLVERESTRTQRGLLAAVDKHLRALEDLAVSWARDVGQVSRVDAALWELVCALRVRTPLRPVRRACPNHCAPVSVCVQADEWPISTGAERGIQENRASARAAAQRLARPRLEAAVTAAALHSICRAIADADTAVRVLQRAWQSASDARLEPCAPARLALSALVDYLAERWICHDAALCCSLIKSWCGDGSSTLQGALATALLAPRRLPPAARASVYCALLQHSAPPHAAFSQLSKFEITSWSQEASPEHRRAALEALTEAVQRHGPEPDESYSMLMELIGVHTAALIDADTLCAVCLWCARAAAALRLPASHCGHVQRAAELCAERVPFDQLGHTLRELGAVWWSARVEGAREHDKFVPYAAHTARLVRTLLAAFLQAAYNQHYTVERVATYGWVALSAAWSPWVTPDRRSALLPLEHSAHSLPPQQLRALCHQLLETCAGAEATILQSVFAWASALFPGGAHARGMRARLAALLAELARLPWQRAGWLTSGAVPILAQTCASGDAEACAWSGRVLRGACAAGWLQGLPDSHLAPHLAAVLYVGTTLPLHPETLEELTQLPWWRLPAMALEPGLERFFADHHNDSVAYHDLLQFRLVLYASELSIHRTLNTFVCRSGASDKRLSAVSLWVCAASAPTVQAHVASATSALLHTITEIAPSLASAEGEVEELLTRAVTILCTEPVGVLSLPVWEQWVSSAPVQLVTACISAAATLTVPDHCAALADTAVRALLLLPQSPGWAEAARRWSASHWRAPVAMATRGRLHAAYGTALAHAPGPPDVRALLQAVAAGAHNFIDSEPILALFACYACRVAWSTSHDAGGAVGAGAAGAGPAGGEDSGAAAEALLAGWALHKRRSLLKALTLQADTDRPTDKLRLLCQFAQCVLSPESEVHARAFEVTCAAVAPPGGDVSGWARAPHPRRLPRLAARLYPAYETYFTVELDCTPEE